MFTSLSHDMRTPLNAITNSLQLSSLIVRGNEKENRSSLMKQMQPVNLSLQDSNDLFRLVRFHLDCY